MKATKKATTGRKFAVVGAVGGALALTLAAGATAPAAHAGSAVSATMQCNVSGSMKIWTASISTAIPDGTSVPVNTPLGNTTVTAVVTTDSGTAQIVTILGASYISGTSQAPYDVEGAATVTGIDTNAADTTLTIPRTAVPSSGGIVTTASGPSGSLTAGPNPGTITISAVATSTNPILVNMKNDDTGAGLPQVPCTFIKSATDTTPVAGPTIATINVTPAVSGGIAGEQTGGALTASGIGLGALGLAAVGGTVLVGRRRQHN